MNLLDVYPKAEIDKLLNKFQILRVPTGTHTSAFFYYKKYPADFLKKTEHKTNIHDTMKEIHGAKSSSGVIKLGNKILQKSSQQPQAQKGNQSKSSISVKTFANPMIAEAKETKGEAFLKVSQKIAEELPSNRTILVVNMDKQYTEDFMRRLFGCVGQVRRVFAGNVNRRSADGGQKRLFYHIIVLKLERDLYRAFDAELFEGRILDKFLPEFRTQTVTEKAQLLKEYLASLEAHSSNTPVPDIHPDAEGFMPVEYVHSKLEDPDKPRTMLDDIEDEMGGKKKKKERFHKDFYKFQLKALKQREEIDGVLGKKKKDAKGAKGKNEEDYDDGMHSDESDDDDVLMGQPTSWGDESDDESDVGVGTHNYNEPKKVIEEDDPDYLKKRKQHLAATFQRQLQEINSKKIKK